MDLIIVVMEASEEEEDIDIDDYTLVKYKYLGLFCL